MNATGEYAGLPQLIHCFHLYVTESAARCYDICTVQQLLGHKDVNTTMIYAHVLNKGAVASGAQPMNSEQPHTVCIRWPSAAAVYWNGLI